MQNGRIRTLSLILIAWILVLFLKGCLETVLYSHGLQKFDVVSKNRSSIQSKGTFVTGLIRLARPVSHGVSR